MKFFNFDNSSCEQFHLCFYQLFRVSFAHLLRGFLGCGSVKFLYSSDA